MSALIPISHAGTDTLSLRQLDELNGVPKGTSFRAFKRVADQLCEGQDYFYLPADEHQILINMLKASGQIYGTTVNLLLFTRSGYERLQSA